MKLRALAAIAVASILAVAHAGPAERVVVAAMHLSDQPNYSWISTVVDDARTYDVVGQTERGGYTRVKMPMINAVRRRLGRSVTDSEIDAIFKGNVRCVIATEEGWKEAAELPAAEPRHAEAELPTINAPARSRKRPALEEMEPGAYSNLQLSICHPHEELGIIVTSHSDLQVEGDIATGKLNDLGAQLLLVHDGQPQITPLRGSGTFKLWMRDGAVVRYVITLEGVLGIETPAGQRDIRVRQKMDTTLSHVGTTKVDVPEDVKRKLGK
jgi:hypothetical protein